MLRNAVERRLSDFRGGLVLYPYREIREGLEGRREPHLDYVRETLVSKQRPQNKRAVIDHPFVLAILTVSLGLQFFC